MGCGKIDRGSNPDCDNLPEGGTKARLVLLNYRDVESIEETVDGIITAINLVPGTFGYEFLGFRTDVKKSEGVLKTQRKNRFFHNVGFVIYEVDQVQKNNIKRLTKGRFIAIVENKGQDENSVEVLGKNVGLSIVDGVVRDAYENGGLFIINLDTPQSGGEFETKLPQTLGFSYEEAQIIIDGLLEEDPWILATGLWDDEGQWIDSALWID